MRGREDDECPVGQPGGVGEREAGHPQRLTGPDAKPDFANPAQMNHFTWYQAHDWATPYPGEDKIVAPQDVPGAYIPAPDSDG